MLERLVKISYFGLDFLNTFLLTFPLFTNGKTVLDHLEKSYWECLRSREKRRGSVTPLDAVRDARGMWEGRRETKGGRDKEGKEEEGKGKETGREGGREGRREGEGKNQGGREEVRGREGRREGGMDVNWLGRTTTRVE